MKSLFTMHIATYKAVYILLLAIVLVSGCTMHLRSEVSPELTVQPANVLPVHAGLYISPEFTRFEQSRIRFQHTSYDIQIGEGCLNGIEQAMPMMVSSFQRVDRLPPYKEPMQEMQFVLEPTIENYDFVTPLFGKGYKGDLELRITAYDMSGTPFASWTLSGHGELESGLGYMTHSRPNGIAAARAVEDAMAKLVAHWTEVPEVNAWMQNNGYVLRP